MLGFHQDAAHPDLGPCHVQLDFEGTVMERYAATFIDAHPLAVLNERLTQFPSTLRAVDWKDGRPMLSEWPD